MLSDYWLKIRFKKGEAQFRVHFNRNQRQPVHDLSSTHECAYHKHDHHNTRHRGQAESVLDTFHSIEPDD